SVNYEDQKKREDGLDQNSLDGAEIDRELRRPRDHNFSAEQAQTNKPGNKRAKQLRAPVTQHRRQIHMTTAKKTEAHRRVKISAGDMHRGANECSNGQPVGKGNAKNVVSGGLDCSHSDENQGKCSDKFGEQRT